MTPIKLLIVDDSLLMQRALENLVGSDEQILVVGTARDGEEALSKISSLHPDVVTMDIEMPRMDGLTAVQRIMQVNPLPVIMVSTLAQREAQITLKALEFGAVDYMPKPSSQDNLIQIKNDLIFKIKTAFLANLTSSVKAHVHENLCAPTNNDEKVISITSSTGGPPAVSRILKSFPGDVPPILITQHMPRGITKFFADGLNEACRFEVKEAEEGDLIRNGLALIAPGGFHMVVNKDRRINLTCDPLVNYVRPSGDVMLFSLADVFGCRNVSVILTGMGSDGANGIRAIKEKGGITIAQDEESSVIFGMPKVALETGCIDIVASLDKMPRIILKACE
jgi:two-component system, chemotaxis family, protein-glutamate methylesterase/glutaminase